MVGKESNTEFSVTPQRSNAVVELPQRARRQGLELHVVDGKLAHGSCADCGDTVYFGESFLRVKEGAYVCVTCVDNRCALCSGLMDGVEPNGGGEICLECITEKHRQSDELAAEMNFAYYAEVQ